MKSYAIRDVFLTVQGEGTRAGGKSVFVRFAGCNLWDGDPAHRHLGKGACAKWCDTDFAKGTSTTLDKLVTIMGNLWPRAIGERWCVLTGGEPLLQVDQALIDALRNEGWSVAIETNGSVEPKFKLDTVQIVTCSPKRGAELKLTACHELKVVLPGDPDQPWSDEELEALGFALHPTNGRFVQPQDPTDPLAVQETYLHPLAMHPHPAEMVDKWKGEFEANVRRCLDFVRTHPTWRVGVQMHKYLRVP